MHRWNIGHSKEITLILHARIQSLIKSLRDTILGYVWCQNDISEKPFPVKLDILYNKCSKIKMWNGSEMGERKRKMDNVKCEIEYHISYIYIKREMCDGKWSVNFNLKLEMGNLKTRMVTLKLNCNIEIEILYWNWIMKMDMKWEMWIWLCNVTLERWNLKLDKTLKN